MNRKRRENHEETLIRHPQNFHYQSFIISVWKYIFAYYLKSAIINPMYKFQKKKKKSLHFTSVAHYMELSHVRFADIQIAKKMNAFRSICSH